MALRPVALAGWFARFLKHPFRLEPIFFGSSIAAAATFPQRVGEFRDIFTRPQDDAAVSGSFMRRNVVASVHRFFSDMVMRLQRWVLHNAKHDELRTPTQRRPNVSLPV